MINIGVIGALLSVLMYITYNIFVKKFARATGNYNAAMMIMVASVVPMLGAAYIFGFGSMSIEALTLSIFAGIFLFLGFELYYRALHTEQLTNSAGVNEVGSALMIVFGVLILNESIPALGYVGIILMFLGSYLIATKKRFVINKRLIPAILASAFFGIFWMFNSYAISVSSNFVLPLLVSRAVGILIAVPYIHLFAKKKIKLKGSKESTALFGLSALLLLIGLFAGIVDGLGDTIMAFITLHRYLAIGGAFGVLTIIGVTIIAYFVYKERLTKLEMLGLVLAIAGALILVVA
jgi:drug/metabolite transporter (DMT)-like permease